MNRLGHSFARLAVLPAILPAVLVFTTLSSAAQAQTNVLPGRVQAEDFRAGAQGTAYNDTTAGNSGGAYRTTDVDIEATTDTGGGFNVGWTAAGEWLSYDVTVNQTAAYTLTFRVASGVTGTKTLRVDVDGATVATLNFTNAGGWQSWANVVANNINLTAGAHVVRVTMVTANINLNWFEAAVAAAPGQLGFGAATYSIGEGGGTLTVTVTRTNGSSGTVGVNYATSNGTATAGSDYTSRTGTL
ncbi:MAG TPA: carbohydrate-binding protein, partial [Polyangia bacterium]